MKIIRMAVLLAALLAGCSLDPDAAEKYKTEKQLEAEIEISQHEIWIKTAPEAEVSVTFWKKGSDAEVLVARKTEEGVFFAEKEMKEHGIYFLKADVKLGRQHIMPTKKIIVGEQQETAPNRPDKKAHSHH